MAAVSSIGQDNEGSSSGVISGWISTYTSGIERISMWEEIASALLEWRVCNDDYY